MTIVVTVICRIVWVALGVAAASSPLRRRREGAIQRMTRPRPSGNAGGGTPVCFY
ncbi:hypothetical protein [Altibacter lentus]|uniref:hypothetical protein n=1 Tax=Altibacter lentus TaxID=1223410 RepID=UPI0013633046|nr:hypothetical protein [Altibacter lentus]